MRRRSSAFAPKRKKRRDTDCTIVTKVFEAYVSPGAMVQKIHCFVGAYSPQDRVSAGGGLDSEGEDIEVIEMDFDEAYAMIADYRIRDAKTIMLLQFARIGIFSD